MKTNKLYTYIGLCLTLAIGLLTQSCRKTEYEQLKRPYNAIQRFVVAGYADLDSVAAVLSDDNILIYWNSDAEIPTKIKPLVAVSAGATIAPASGEEVDFSENTVYTVTAEDGTVKQYKLKPVLNKAIPVLLTVPVRFSYASTTSLSIVGEYFMSGGDASNIKLYMQRIRDGFEFDVPIDIQKTTATNIIASLPVLTSELDTGRHRLYVKVGDFASNYSDIWLSQPDMTQLVTGMAVNRKGNVFIGDEFKMSFTIKQGWEDAFKRFYNKDNINSIQFSMGISGQNATNVNINSNKELYDVDENGNITIKLLSGSSIDLANNIIYGGTLRYNTKGVNTIGEFVTGVSQFQYFLYETTSTIGFAAGIPTSDRIVIRATDYVYTPVRLTFVQSGQQIKSGATLRINPSYEDDAASTEYRRKINAIKFTFLNSTTNTPTVVNVSTFTDLGIRATFVLPTIANLPTGSILQSIEVNFTSASGGNDFKATLDLTGTNTTFSN